MKTIVLACDHVVVPAACVTLRAKHGISKDEN